MELTSSRIKHLRKLARNYKVAAQIGKSGISDGMLHKLDFLLADQELIKLRILNSCPEDCDEIIEILCEATGAALVAELGSTLIFYRPNPQLPQPRRISFSLD